MKRLFAYFRSFRQTRIPGITLIFLMAPGACADPAPQYAVPPGSKPAAATQEDCGCDVPPPSGPQLWGTVNGVNLYDTEFKSLLAPQIDPLLQKLKDLRIQGLNLLIHSRILDREAKAAGINRIDFISRGVDPTLQNPTEAEMDAWIAKNPPQNPADKTVPAYRTRVSVFLKDQKRQEAIKVLAESLKKNHRLTLITNANTADAEGQRVLAVLDEDPIRRADLDEFLKSQLYDIKKQIFEIRKQALDRKIFLVLLEAEAGRRNLAAQVLVNQEILDKAPVATTEQVDKFYNENRAQIPQPLDQVRGNIANYLRQEALKQQEQRLMLELSKKASIQYSLPGIIEPVYKVGTEGKPVKGAIHAPVTIVEFSDYECPFCAKIQPVLKQILELYSGKVRLVAREFPIVGHVFARRAALAAESAFAQGKYFEYTALLYQNQQDLSEPNLIRFAQMTGMDIARLKADMAANRYERAIEEDVEEAKRVGLTSTPTFYINGRKLEILSLDGFKQAIDRELAAAAKAAPAAPNAAPVKTSVK
jgi:protein-disulfide isomerase